MIFSIKKLTSKEKAFCKKTISSRATYALVGDAIVRKEGMSIVRMGDGERHLLAATDEGVFDILEGLSAGWLKRLGIEGLSLAAIQERILEAGNSCTYFAPSVSGISYRNYHLYDYFTLRRHYLDNFFINEWTKDMIQRLLKASNGVYIMHNEHETVIQNFQKNYDTGTHFSGFRKTSARDNEAAIKAAKESDAQLILFSAGPAGKVIGPRIAAETNKVVLDVGNTLIQWSEKAG